MQIDYSGKTYTTTSHSTQKNINALKMLVEHGVRLEDIKSSDKASDFLPEIFNSSNDVAVGEILRSLRYRTKNNTLPQIWKDFLYTYNYNFNISKLRGEQQSRQYSNNLIKVLQIFVDHGINLNDIPQRAKAKEILSNKFNDENNFNIGAILQYMRTKYKSKSLDNNLVDFLTKNNFAFDKQSQLKAQSLIKKQTETNAKASKRSQDKQKKEQKSKDCKHKPEKTKIINKETFSHSTANKLENKNLSLQQTKNQNVKDISTSQSSNLNETNKIYKKSKNKPRKKAQILKLIVANGINLNNVEKSALASQLLPAKTIIPEEDFCVGKLIIHAKKKYAKNLLKPAAIQTLTKLGVELNMHTKSLFSKCIFHTKSSTEANTQNDFKQSNPNQADDEDNKGQPSADINCNNNFNC